MQSAWLPLVPLLQAADKLPFSPLHAPIKGKDGQWYLAEEDNYLVQQYLPFMAQVQRLLPDKGKYQGRAVTSWLSYLTGTQMRTNTPQDQENEIFARSGEVGAILNKLKAAGYVTPPKPRKERKPGRPLADVLADLDTE